MLYILIAIVLLGLYLYSQWLCSQIRIRFLIKGMEVMEARLTNIQEVDVTVEFLNSLENPVGVDGVPTWLSSDETIATVAASADGMTATIRTTGAIGSCQITVRGDADLTSGTIDIVGVLDVVVTASGAVQVNFTLGVPRTRSI